MTNRVTKGYIRRRKAGVEAGVDKHNIIGYNKCSFCLYAIYLLLGRRNAMPLERAWYKTSERKTQYCVVGGGDRLVLIFNLVNFLLMALFRSMYAWG